MSRRADAGPGDADVVDSVVGDTRLAPPAHAATTNEPVAHSMNSLLSIVSPDVFLGIAPNLAVRAFVYQTNLDRL